MLQAATPIATNCLMDADEAGNQVDSTKYRGLIGSLLYLTASRPYIQFGVFLWARFQSNPKESHFKPAKRILKYLKGTINVGLWYPNESNIALSGFSDSDYAGCKLDRKSTSGTCHLLGSNLISWNSKKQACVALSTAEAKYIAVGHACAQSIWLKHQLMDYGVKLEKVPFYCDNTSAINLTKNPIQHSKTKHIVIRHHFIRDHIQKGQIEIMFVKTENQLANLFTKPLARDRFNKLRTKFGILDVKNICWYLFGLLTLLDHVCATFKMTKICIIWKLPEFQSAKFAISTHRFHLKCQNLHNLCSGIVSIC